MTGHPTSFAASGILEICSPVVPASASNIVAVWQVEFMPVSTAELVGMAAKGTQMVRLQAAVESGP